MGAAGKKKPNETGAAIAGFIATLYPSMSGQQKVQAKVLIRSITNQPTKQTLKQLTRLLASLGTQKPGIRRRIDNFMQALQSKQAERAVVQAQEETKLVIAQKEVAERDMNGLIARTMTYMVATGAILSKEAARKERFKEAARGRKLTGNTTKGLSPIAADKILPTNPDGTAKYARDRNRRIRFLTQNDAKVDDQCIPFHGLPFTVNAPNRPIQPIHPNCRCVWQDIETGKIIGQF